MSDGVGAVRSCDGSLEFGELTWPTALVPSVTSRGLGTEELRHPLICDLIVQIDVQWSYKRRKEKKKKKEKKKRSAVT